MILGLSAGAVAILYRYLLSLIDPFLLNLAGLVKTKPSIIALCLVMLTMLALIINYLLKKESLIAGSGIPQVEAELNGMFKTNHLKILLFKFIGGLLCAFGGLSLGREGPSIQLGAMAASYVNQKLSLLDERLALTVGSASGLAAAFSAPLAGVMFALEELHHNFNSKVLVLVMIAAVSADAFASIFFGFATSFNFVINDKLALELYPLVMIEGILIGLLGVFYNRMTLKFQSMFKKIPRIYRLAIAFAFSLLFLCFFPYVLGGGHLALEYVRADSLLSFIALLLILKLLFSFISFGSGAVGGIFFPLLVIGSLFGSLYALSLLEFNLIEQSYFYNFVILAMAGFFSAIVRAPITGIILIFEMTGSLSNLLALTLVSLIAYLVAEAMKCDPIYESLLDNYQSEEERSLEVENINLVISYGSCLIDKMIRDIDWPMGVQVTMILRHGENVIASGATTLKMGDTLSFAIQKNNYYAIKKELEESFNLK